MENFAQVSIENRDEFFHMVYWDEQNGTKEMMPWIRNEQRIIRTLGWWEDYKGYVKKQKLADMEISEKAKKWLLDKYSFSQDILSDGHSSDWERKGAEKMSDILGEIIDKLGLELK